MRALRADVSGNALMLTAMGAPVIFGGAGLGVDLAQYYMFKRELQYAVDQAAVAGAWARGNGDKGVYYKTRALQEFSANLSTTSGYSPTLTYDIQDYGDDKQNSVVVTAKITTNLPFSKLLIGSATDVAVKAQASFEELEEYNPCLYALNTTANSALWFNGDPTVDAKCGVGARSTSATSVRTNGGSGPQDINFAISGGSISDGSGAFENAAVVENLEDLIDPFEGITPPDNSTPRTLSCGYSTGKWTADEKATKYATYKYYKGQTEAKAVKAGVYTYSGAQAPTTTITTTLSMTFTSQPVDYTSDLKVVGPYKKTGNGPDTIWEEESSTTKYEYSNIVQETAAAGAMQPGTYTDFEISCDTVLSSGIYVINGGKFKLNAGNKLIGSGVLFVLKGGAELQINGGAEVSLSPMSSTEMVAAGVDSETATKIAGMLIFEDPSSAGSAKSKINGGANFELNGIVYMPRSDVQLAGHMRASSQCLMLMSNTIQISGTADLTTLCPVGKEPDVVVGGGGTRVRLVS
ncbi:TadE/TadG family type IV pilus assembly protein [Qipengyuania sp. RANM35]|uniref:TadE/TadG family type IV pilus assembly protein n=1 Tax=Qipengyuania sp. RANM35 TaxID=3068635 RepID=UPI0034DB37B6